MRLSMKLTRHTPEQYNHRRPHSSLKYLPPAASPPSPILTHRLL